MLAFCSFSTFPYIFYKHQGNDNDKVFLLHEQASYIYRKTFSSIEFYHFMNLNFSSNIQFNENF